MVRGRITEINGQAPRDAVPADARGDNSLRRELNLTWQSELPEGNQVVAGQWFTPASEPKAGSGRDIATQKLFHFGGDGWLSVWLGLGEITFAKAATTSKRASACAA